MEILDRKSETILSFFTGMEEMLELIGDPPVAGRIG
jgi:hypothetical protein